MCSTGSALFRSTASGYSSADVTATENDDDVTIAITAGTGGSTTPSGNIVIDKDTMPYTVTANPAAGYVFVNWTDSSGILANANAASTTLTASSAATIKANFSLVTIDLVVATDPLFVAEGSSCRTQL